MATPPQPTEANHKQRWAEYFNALMKVKDWTNRDVVRALDSRSYNPSVVSAWSNGTASASERACLRIAETFARPVSEVLRAAGHTEMADWIDAHQPGRTDEDPITARIREIARDLPPAPRRELEDSLLAQIAALEEYARLKTAELLRQAQQDDGDGEQRGAR